jgi:type I restriction enzyme R subunit/putative DNA methylase
MDRLLDKARIGPVYLRTAQIAKLMVEAIHHRACSQRHYDLHSYVVMTNDIHLLVTPWVPVSKLTHSLKRFTAREANRILGLTGQRFWQDESYDRLGRDDSEFQRISRYIEWNPVNTGLVTRPGEFPWSSARPIDNRPQVSNLPHTGQPF